MDSSYTVTLTERSRREMRDIAAYISQTLREPGAALHLLETIMDEILSLEQLPRRYPEIQSGMFAHKGYRKLFVKNYTVIYRIEEEQRRVLIVSVRYSGRLS